MRVQVGSFAPVFHTTDIAGKQFDLAESHGRYTLLAFHRFIACPFCNFRIHELKSRVRDFPEVRVVTVFASSVETIAQSGTAQSYPFTFLSDPGQALYEMYGVGSSISGFLLGAVRRPGQMVTAVKRGLPKGGADGALARMPADFLLAPDLSVVAAHYGLDAGDHLPIDRIVALVSSLRLRVA